MHLKNFTNRHATVGKKPLDKSENTITIPRLNLNLQRNTYTHINENTKISKMIIPNELVYEGMKL